VEPVPAPLRSRRCSDRATAERHRRDSGAL